MNEAAHTRFRLSAQRALLGNVSPALRQVSISIDEISREYRVRVVYDTTATDDDIEDADSAATEITGDFLDWNGNEEIVRCGPPDVPTPLDWLVYSRKEGNNT